MYTTAGEYGWWFHKEQHLEKIKRKSASLLHSSTCSLGFYGLTAYQAHVLDLYSYILEGITKLYFLFFSVLGTNKT